MVFIMFIADLNPLKCTLRGERIDILITGVSYRWYPSLVGLPNLYSVIDG